MLDYTQDPDLAAIRLIACDMDLTLLADDGSQPDGMPERIQALAEAGVIFCPASGRPGTTLAAMFPEHAREMAFCPDNGGSLIWRGETIYKSLIDPALIHDVLSCAVERRHGAPVLCCFDEAYVLARDAAYHKNISVYYPTINYIDTFEGLDVESNKISIYFPDFDSKSEFDEVFEPRFGQALNVTCAGGDWIDFMNVGVNKGTGITRLCELLGIDLADAAAIGDTYNDIQMLETVGHSFVVANAEPHMHEHARYLAPSNNDRGVASVIDAILTAKAAR